MSNRTGGVPASTGGSTALTPRRTLETVRTLCELSHDRQGDNHRIEAITEPRTSA
jgi:hypothetical protein